MGDPNDASLVGKTAGKYRVLTRIGTGTMGHVYEAEHVDNGQHVALKVLHKHHQEEFAARFLREGKTLQLLDHPNIVRLVDMGRLDNGGLYLATELIRGKTLRDLMNQGPVEPRRALAIVRQLLEALEAAHELGVVHRDIKPENIMLDGDTVKVLDFGVAKLLADTIAGLGEANLTSVGFSIFGSALYIAPESVTGQPIDARIDIYSVGAMLYEILTGRPPYDHEDPTEILKQHAFAPVPSLALGAPQRTFTQQVEQLVGRAMSKQPDARFRTARDMIVAVDLAAQSLEPPRPLVWPVPEPTTGKGLRLALPRKGLVIAAGIGAALVVALVVVLFTRHRTVPVQNSEALDRAKPLIAAGDHKGAAEMLEKELAHTPDADALLVLGHERFAAGRQLDGLAAYEHALRLRPQLGANKDVRANAQTALGTRDSLTAVLALEVLGSLDPPATDALVAYASTGKLEDARHRAVILAEREGAAAKIDRVESWGLDLQQASTCDERKVLIEKLAATADRRALAALKRIKTPKCVERDAAEAIARLEAANGSNDISPKLH